MQSIHPFPAWPGGAIHPKNGGSYVTPLILGHFEFQNQQKTSSYKPENSSFHRIIRIYSNIFVFFSRPYIHAIPRHSSHFQFIPTKRTVVNPYA